MEREVLAVKQRVLGAEHPDTLTAAGNLAASLSNQGKHDEAEKMQREVLAVEKRVLGAEHPDTLTAAGNLALSLARQGKHDEAEKMASMGDFEEIGGMGGRGPGGFRGRGRGGGSRGRGGRSGGAPEGPIDQLKLYVGSLSWGVDDESLQAEFSKFGPCEVRRAGDDWNPVPARACLASALAVHFGSEECASVFLRSSSAVASAFAAAGLGARFVGGSGGLPRTTEYFPGGRPR